MAGNEAGIGDFLKLEARLGTLKVGWQDRVVPYEVSLIGARVRRDER